MAGESPKPGYERLGLAEKGDEFSSAGLYFAMKRLRITCLFKYGRARHSRTWTESAILLWWNALSLAFRLNTGLLSTPFLFPVLCDMGEIDIAYRILQNREKPDWLYPVLRGIDYHHRELGRRGHTEGFSQPLFL